MKKKIAVAVAGVLAMVALLVFLPMYVALLVMAGVMFLLLLFSLFFASLKSWTELEKKDPKKAREMWAEAMMQIEADRYRYML